MPRWVVIYRVLISLLVSLVVASCVQTSDGLAINKATMANLGSALRELSASIQFNVRQLVGKEGTVPCDPGKPFQLCLYTVYISPEQAQAGDTVTATMQYGVITSSNRSVPVTEKRILLLNGKVVAVLDRTVNRRKSGTWQTKLSFKVPNNANGGLYTLRQEIEAHDVVKKGISLLTISGNVAHATN